MYKVQKGDILVCVRGDKTFNEGEEYEVFESSHFDDSFFVNIKYKDTFSTCPKNMFRLSRKNKIEKILKDL
jgi:hypothetical protein